MHWGSSWARCWEPRDNPCVSCYQPLNRVIVSSLAQILILAIISTAVTPLIFLVGEAPPTPPSKYTSTANNSSIFDFFFWTAAFAATKKFQSLSPLVRAMLGQEPESSEACMSRRERVDFAIITLIFGVLVAAWVNVFQNKSKYLNSLEQLATPSFPPKSL